MKDREENFTRQHLTCVRQLSSKLSLFFCSKCIIIFKKKSQAGGEIDLLRIGTEMATKGRNEDRYEEETGLALST